LNGKEKTFIYIPPDIVVWQQAISQTEAFLTKDTARSVKICRLDPFISIAYPKLQNPIALRTI
jgi:hypothetical protein